MGFCRKRTNQRDFSQPDGKSFHRIGLSGGARGSLADKLYGIRLSHKRLFQAAGCSLISGVRL